MRVNETDNDQFICANIQKRIKSRTWSAQLSQLNTFFLTSRRQNARKVLLIYVPLVRAVTGTSIRPTKKWYIWVMTSKEKKKFVYHEKYHLFISSAVTHYN